MPEDIPVPAPDVEAGDEIEAVPEILVDGPADSVTIHDDLVVTPTSPIKLLRDACKWLSISQAGSKVRMFNRIQRARDLAIKRSVVEAAKDQYRQQYPEVHSIPLPPQPSEKDKAEHMLTHTPFQPWCEFCVKSRSRANQHPHVSDPAHDAQREYPTVQCDFFFMEPGKEDAVIALLMVDVWSRYVSVMPLKPRNTQTVGNALVKFLNDVGRVEKMELAGDNEPVLAAGMRFCQRTRQTLGMETILTWNRTYEKTRTSIAERFVQTVRGLQKTLLSHLESAIQATIPAGHPVIQWAAMHASWIYNRYHVHSSLRTTPFQSLFGRPYRGKIVAFGQTVFGLDPKADKYRPAWIRGAWLGKDSSDMDLISTDGQNVVRTKAIRRIGDEWDATLVLGMDVTPSQVFGHRQIRRKQTIVPLGAPGPQKVDEDAEAVRDYVSEGYSPSEGPEAHAEDPTTEARTWEEAGLENPFSPVTGLQTPVSQTPVDMESETGGGVPITPVLDETSDHDMDIPAVATKHAASSSLAGERVKAQKMDDDPIPMPKTKASRTDGNVNQVEEIEMYHNDESMFPEGFEDDAVAFDSEDEYIAVQGEHDGPPSVSPEKLQELEEQAALDEVEKLFQMDVIQPVTLQDDVATSENVVDTTLVYDWRYRNQQWIRRCRIVAREFKTGATDENNFSPTSSFASVRMLLTFALIYNLAVTALDVKDAFLMVPQMEVLYVKIPAWIRKWTGSPHTHWLLKRCLPGQRNAALRWHQHIGGLCERSGLEAFPGAPTILRHCDLSRRMFVNIHVDDILLVCNPRDVEWFQTTVGETLTMKVDGPHLPGSGSQLLYLKKRMTMKPNGILLQPNSSYIPKLVALMKVSGRRKKGLPYHATLENFNADLVIESEMLDPDQAAVFRSGLGLALYLAMDRPDIQFAVKTLSSYMARPSVKALSALKHLASYLDGTPEDGLLLQCTEESQCIFDGWRDDELVSEEIPIPADKAEARFNIEAFSDSSWADCKSTRKSTSSGLVFLNGAMILSICRTQASVALSSCEAELYAANGLMVECMYLYRLCKFLCKDELETNSCDVQQRFYIDSSSAMALIHRAGTGRLKHVQIKQFFLQSLLRAGIFTIHKINTKLNPGDLNTKRLSSERRKFLGRLIGLFMDADETNDDSEVRRVRRSNRVAREQCVRLIKVATAALGMFTQLKGCSPMSNAEIFEQDTAWLLVANAVEGLMTSTLHGFVMMVAMVCKAFMYMLGLSVLVAGVTFLFLGPLTWNYSRLTWWCERRCAWRTMGWRHRLFIYPSLQIARWRLEERLDFYANAFERPTNRVI